MGVSVTPMEVVLNKGKPGTTASRSAERHKLHAGDHLPQRSVGTGL